MQQCKPAKANLNSQETHYKRINEILSKGSVSVLKRRSHRSHETYFLTIVAHGRFLLSTFRKTSTALRTKSVVKKLESGQFLCLMYLLLHLRYFCSFNREYGCCVILRFGIYHQLFFLKCMVFKLTRSRSPPVRYKIWLNPFIIESKYFTVKHSSWGPMQRVDLDLNMIFNADLENSTELYIKI